MTDGVHSSQRSISRITDQTLYYAGGVYFLADLDPGPIWLERSDMVADSRQVRRFQRHFRRHVDQFDHIVSLIRDSGEIRAFQEANPGFTVTEIAAGEARVWIYGRGGGAAPPSTRSGSTKTRRARSEASVSSR